MDLKLTILVFVATICSVQLVSAQRTAIVPETLQSLSGAVECYTQYQNRTVLPSCKHLPGTVILVQGLYVGSKLETAGCPDINLDAPFNETVCCLPNLKDDCIFLYSYEDCCETQIYHQVCTGLPQCSERKVTSWAPTASGVCLNHSLYSLNQSLYMPQTYLMFMDYSCVDETRIFPINWTDPIQGTDEPVYLQTPGYPGSTMDENFVVRCRAVSSSNVVTVYTIDVRLSGNNGACEEHLSFSSSTGGFNRSCNESIDEAFNVTKTDFHGSVDMVFQSRASGYMGHVWIGFKGADLKLNCTYERLRDKPPTSPKPGQPHRGGPTSGGSGLSGGAIAGIVIAFVLLILIVLLILLCCWCKKKKQKEEAINPEVAGTGPEEGIVSGQASVKSDFLTSVRAFKNSFVNTFTGSKSAKYAFAAPGPTKTAFRPGMTIQRGNTGDELPVSNGNSFLKSKIKSSSSSFGRPLPVMMPSPEENESEATHGSNVDLSNYKLPFVASLYLGPTTPKSGSTKQSTTAPNNDFQEGTSYLGPSSGHLPPIGGLLPPINQGLPSTNAPECGPEGSGEGKKRRKRKHKKRRRRSETTEQTTDDIAIDE